MMSFLNAARIIAGILLIACITYFIATRGGNVDVPMPWGQSATMQIPGPELERPQQAASVPAVIPESTPTAPSLVGIWSGGIALDESTYVPGTENNQDVSDQTFIEFEFYPSGQFEITLQDARTSFDENGVWTQDGEGNVEWRTQGAQWTVRFRGRIVGDSIEGYCCRPYRRVRLFRAEHRMGSSTGNN